MTPESTTDSQVSPPSPSPLGQGPRSCSHEFKLRYVGRVLLLIRYGYRQESIQAQVRQ